MEFKIAKVVTFILGAFLFKVIVADSYLDNNRKPSSVRVRTIDLQSNR